MNCSFHPLVAMDFLIRLGMQKQLRQLSDFFRSTPSYKHLKKRGKKATDLLNYV